MPSPYDPLHDLFVDYAASLRLALCGGGAVADAVALTRQDSLDGEWERESIMLPPRSRLGLVSLSRPQMHRLLYVVSRQLVWPDENHESFSMASRPAGAIA
jgi:hypothetical protein